MRAGTLSNRFRKKNVAKVVHHTSNSIQLRPREFQFFFQKIAAVSKVCQTLTANQKNL